jgi:hypothetical protein
MTEEEVKKPSLDYTPISAWGYFGYHLLFSIPLVGFICLIVFAISANNINLRNFARSYFCAVLVAIIIVVIGFVLRGADFVYILRQLINELYYL